MDKLQIDGGRPLIGEVQNSGSKNGTLPLLAASLLVEGETIIENVPDIYDVRTMIEVLGTLGARCHFDAPGVLRIDASQITSVSPPDEQVSRMRGSFYVAGPLLARFGEAKVPLPGGCLIGSRPVDYHIAGFKAMGAKVQNLHGVMDARAGRLKGYEHILDGRTRSVGATINIMMAATLAEGTSVIENASHEPEVIACEELLISMGAKISGVGTSRLIIEGVEKLHPTRCRAIADRMEAGTFLVAGLITGGDVTVVNCRPEHFRVVLRELVRCGASIERGSDYVRLRGRQRPTAVEITTGPYPGFPTDLQPNMAVVGTIAVGTSVIDETIFDMRFTYADELVRMGANIMVKDRVAIIRGVEKLSGAPVQASDLRAGSALALAGLAADGHTEIGGAQVLDRGYESFVNKLKALGAEISRHQGQVEEQVC